MKSILDPTFRYVKSADTDIRKTFARSGKARDRRRLLEDRRRAAQAKLDRAKRADERSYRAALTVA